MTDPLDGGARKEGAKAALVERREIGKGRGPEIVTRPELCFVTDACKLVPWTDRKAVVASVDAVAHRHAKLQRDRSRMLDVEIGEAPPRIELERSGECRRRTNIEALSARAAALLVRLVDRQLRRREDRPEKQPGPELATDQHCMLPLP